MIAGEEPATAGPIHVDGRVGFMHQFIGSDARPTTVREFLLAYAEPPVRAAAARVATARGSARASDTGERAQLAYADALDGLGERRRLPGRGAVGPGGARRRSAAATPRAPSAISRRSPAGERKRLALEAVLGGPFDVLLLDEPDNTLDIAGQDMARGRDRARTRARSLFVSHDRTVLDRAATRIVTLEGRAAWTHHGPFATYAEARDARIERLDERHRRYEEERKRLDGHGEGDEAQGRVQRRLGIEGARRPSTGSSASRSARRRRRRPRSRTCRCASTAGGRARWRSVPAGWRSPGIVEPFDAEFRFGERVGVIGPNGTGKTHFLRLLAGEPIAHEGEWMLGARVEPALFAQLHERPDVGETADRRRAAEEGPRPHAARCRRCVATSSTTSRRNPFELLSGGQQARFQILLMEIDSPTMLLLDEPTDNLDVASADALEEALAAL